MCLLYFLKVSHNNSRSNENNDRWIYSIYAYCNIKCVLSVSKRIQSSTSFLLATFGGGSDYELAVIEQLLANYDKRVRPAKNSNLATIVELSLASNGGTALKLIKLVLIC